MKMQVFLKGGGQFTVHVTSYEISRDVYGGISKLKWVTPENAKERLTYLDAEQIAAVVRVD